MFIKRVVLELIVFINKCMFLVCIFFCLFINYYIKKFFDFFNWVYVYMCRFFLFFFKKRNEIL